MARPKSFRELIVWQKAMAMARSVYTASELLPKREAYGLANQIRRSAISVPSNIAEGYGRLTDLQFRHFLGNARGSLYELQTQIELGTSLGYFEVLCSHKLMEQGEEVGRLINGLIASMKVSRGTKPASSANPAGSANAAFQVVQE